MLSLRRRQCRFIEKRPCCDKKAVNSLIWHGNHQKMTIIIDGPYFIGIFAGFVTIAWYTSARFTALETSMQWVKDILNDLKIGSDNAARPAFGSHSPVSLNELGEAWLTESGLKDYIDSHKADLMKICEEKRDTNPYEVQKHIFKSFDNLVLETNFDDNLKKFAFDKETTMGILRRIGAIYFRNVCLVEFGMSKEDIDKHDPDKKTSP